MVSYAHMQTAQLGLGHGERNEGHTGFEPVSNSFTNCFLSHLDHDPVPDKGIEP